MIVSLKAIAILLSILASFVTAQEVCAQDAFDSPKDCGEMESWDVAMQMCMPRAMPGMSMKMLMARGNAFFLETTEEGPRGRNAFSVPDFYMIDYGSSIGSKHYVNLDFMGTFELWTFPSDGTPELLQIGETQSSGQPFLDAQHPHSSPIMGITLSDTISIGAKDYAKIWFAPRGESTDGPVAFMHRPTGMVNPDAPLGHHVGQDVGHISSTVFGASLKLSNTNLEASTFNGIEPEPTVVNLPMAAPNSYGLRLTQTFSPHFFVMASAAYVKNPEPDDPSLDHLWRYSASIYNDWDVGEGSTFHNAIIWGLINDYDNAAALNSFAEEFWFHTGKNNFWGRFEVLQRTPAELQIVGVSDLNDGQWVTAATFGFTREVAKIDSLILGLGGSVTADFLPSDYQSVYSGNPLSGKIFLQASGSRMWNL